MSSLNQGFKTYLKSVQTAHKNRCLSAADYAYRRTQVISPVKSGAFKANMNRTITEPDFSFDKNKTSGEVPPVVSPRFFDNYYIANGAPYAFRLEHGWSEQSPGGIFNVIANDLRNKYR